MTYRSLYQWGKKELAEVGIAEGDLDARLLLEHICNTNRNTLLAHPELEVEAGCEQEYRKGIDRRKKHIPLQHITGVQEFMGLEFRVNEKVLIPRQDTETLVEEVMRFLQDGDRILDLCTGSGCILLSLLHYSNHCKGVGVDLSAQALQVARENEESIRKRMRPVPWVEDTVKWVESDLYTDCEKTGYDIIVSNPPYIASAVLETLMEEVKEHEPRLALDGKEDGLFFYREIIRGSKDYLKKEGRLFLEIGYDQAGSVVGMLEEAGFQEVTVVKDFAGLDRVVHGVWEGRSLEENNV